MAQNKTQITDVPVATFLEKVAPDRRRADAEVLIGLMARLTGEPAGMYGPSIIGFGKRRYRTAAGREGVMPLLCFSPRKPHLVFYGLRAGAHAAALIERLGEFKNAGGCVYVKTLDDIDFDVLEELLAATLAAALPHKI